MDYSARKVISEVLLEQRLLLKIERAIFWIFGITDIAFIRMICDFLYDICSVICLLLGIQLVLIHFIQSVVEDVVYFMNEMNMEKAIWLGHSYGGKVAYMAGLLYPEYVSSIIALDILPQTPLRSRWRDYSKLLQILQKIPSMKFKSRSEIEQFVLREKPDMSIFEVQFVTTTLSQTESDKGKDEWYLKMNVDGLLSELENIAKFDVDSDPSDEEPVYEAPTYLIRGGASDFVHDDDLPAFYERFPNSTVMTVDGASHYLHIEKRKETIECVARAIQEIDASSL